MKLYSLSEFPWEAAGKRFVYVAAAGFENRSLRGAQIIVNAGLQLLAALLLEFRERRILQNERNLERLKKTLGKRLSSDKVLVSQIDTVETIWEGIQPFLADESYRVIVDVGGMPHATILRVLRSATLVGVRPIILYTEAKGYYPSLEDANTYLRIDDDEQAFAVAAKQESGRIMYAGLASIGTVKGYEGRINPTAPTVIIAFPTFKRTRLASILAELEVRKKIFFIGKPVRKDLEWRERALRVINHDLIDENTDYVKTLSTLSPGECRQALEGLYDEGVVSPADNVIICPHGSKMQTIGVWRFCEDHRDVRVVLSHPSEFFPKKYSVGHGESFVLNTEERWAG